MARFWNPARRLVLWVAVGIVAVVLVVLVALVATGVLVVPTSTTKSVTISEVELHVVQGTIEGGQGWFGPSYVNYTGPDGYPQTVDVGASWTVVWMFSNFDSANHTIYNVTPSAPFTVSSTEVADKYPLPYTAAGGSDDLNLAIAVSVPSGASGTYVVTLTVDAETPG